jgi:hypothetical protein
MNPTTTYAQRPGTQPARARVAVERGIVRERVAAAVPASQPALAIPAPMPLASMPIASVPVPSMVNAGHAWQGTGFDATDGALGTTKCSARLLGPRTT